MEGGKEHVLRTFSPSVHTGNCHHQLGPTVDGVRPVESQSISIEGKVVDQVGRYLSSIVERHIGCIRMRTRRGEDGPPETGLRDGRRTLKANHLVSRAEGGVWKRQNR